MQIGVVFPHADIDADAGAIRAFGTAVDGLGFDHIVGYDHVAGADPAVHEGWNGPYDVDTRFHEPLVLFGFLAAITRVELVPGVLVLPQRQTVLVAKQAAQVDILAEGRFRLGVGVGWNKVEYDALGLDFHTRGARLDGQVELMRRLWTEHSITTTHGDEVLVGAGLAPLPVQRPIPVWFGGYSAAAYRRIGRIGDGWFPMMSPTTDEFVTARETVEKSAREAGRDPSAIGMEGGIGWRDDPDKVLRHVEVWQGVGASHVFINTMRSGQRRSMDEHVAAFTEIAAALGLPR